MMWRFAFRVVLLFAFILGAGFVVFLFSLPGVRPVQAMSRADAIVVLTGGGGSRIRAAADLLAGQHGRRLLISGVNRTVRPAAIQSLFHLDAQTMQCCVDLDYRARNTLGNADEIAAWARAHGFSRLIVVTSTYHMPRTLIELRAALPEASLLPFAVRPPARRGARNWRLVWVEYIKYALIFSRQKLAQAGLGGAG